MTEKVDVNTLPEFDEVDYLGSAEARAAYLSDAMQDDDPAEFRRALANVARSLGMGTIANEANVGRTSLYKSLSEQGDPKFSTVLRVMAAMGIGLSARPLAPAEPEQN